MKLVITENEMIYILEGLGVAESTLPYVNLVYRVLEEKVSNILDENPKSYNEKIKLGNDYIKEIYQNYFDDFIEFPIESIVINLSFNVIKKTFVSGSFSTGGAAYQIDNKREGGSYIKRNDIRLPKRILEEIDDCFVAVLDFEIYINQNFNTSMKDDLMFDLRDTILHEFNHLYEYYKRNQSNKSFVNTSLISSGSKNYNIPKSIFSNWEKFLDLVYYSEPYEINAMTQESYSKVLRMDFNDFKKTSYWLNSKKMENFNADDYYNMLIKSIESHNPEYVDSIVSRLYSWFTKDYLKNIKLFKSEPSKIITKSNNLLDLIRNFEPRINNAGKKLQRNYMRLYSLSLD